MHRTTSPWGVGRGLIKFASFQVGPRKPASCSIAVIRVDSPLFHAVAGTRLRQFLLDRLIGASEQGRRDGQSERLCRPEIDYEFERSQLFDGNVAGSGFLQRLDRLQRVLAIERDEAWSISD